MEISTMDDEIAAKTEEGTSGDNNNSVAKEISSDLIVKNMEEVLKSIKKEKKKKHKLKHKHHKDKKRDNEEEIDAATPKDDEKTEQGNKENVSKKPTNAFALMMNARKQSIGSNSNGTEVEASTSSPSSQNSAKRKRKEMLQEWSDNKGGRARREAEEAGEQYVQKELKKRATRLKNLLVNGKKAEKTSDYEVSDDLDSADDDFTPTSGGRKTKIKILRKSSKVKRRKISETQEEDSQDSKNFVSKLGSPIKKRDSLLGYFAKVNKSDENLVESPKSAPKNGKIPKNQEIKSPTSSFTPSKITPRRIARRRNTPVTPVVVEIPAETSTPSTESDSRPRRSCTMAPKSYKFESPDGKTKKKETKKTEEDEKMYIELSDESMDAVTPTRKPAKLAAIFNKKLPKPVLDPEVAKARQEFLRSGLPETIRVEQERQREFEEAYEVKYFPSVSHVTQNEAVTPEIIDWSCSKFKFRTNFDENCMKNDQKLNLIDVGDFKSQEKVIPELSWCHVKDRKAHGRKLKMLFETFPTYKCFHQLHEKQKASLNTAELFTEKYKPRNSEQFLVNPSPIASLKRFLSSWRETKSENYDSANDFEDSSCSMSSSVAGSNVILIHGPSGSGKTSSVHALANEMHFNVLEINAGAKRTGKKMLQELLEATQSHQMFRKDKSKLAKLQRNNSTSSNSSSESSKKISLILIEDADVILDQDDGFISGISQLVAISKRPVILTAINANLPHLSSYLHQNSIQFTPPSPSAASKFLTVMCLAENFIASDTAIRKLYEKNHCDFRKTILQLQFYFETGGDVKQIEEKIVKNDDDDEEMIEVIPVTEADMQEIEDENSKGSHLSYEDPETGAPIEHQHKLFVDFFSGKRVTQRKIIKKGANMDEISSLSELMSSIHMLNRAGDEMHDELLPNVNAEVLEMLSCDTTLKRPVSKSPKLYENLPLLSQTTTSRDCLLDYEPILRDICRSEKQRLANDRKGSRFYHYLRNLNPVNFSKDYFDQFTEILS
ncbi:enhanced level of genomic instability 1 [Culicoides brevitarsis]|uniref:enhanced level of genomic instability 1 n=1 Tax=Culicoides brevitarsis TaxID=469753 RepID=UPI00307C0163